MKAAKILLTAVGFVIWIMISGCQIQGTEVHFDNGEVTLSGTLVRPETAGRVPAVVLIHGSGETDRSDLQHYAEIFLRNGLAILIYDKRGVGQSQGDPQSWRRFNFDDLAGDAAAAVSFLTKRPDIDPHHIGLFGVSQGGWVAPLAAEKSGRVAFMILLSASVTTVAEDRLFERAARLKSEGFTESEVLEARQMQRVDQQLTRSGENFEEFAGLWEQNKDKRWFRRVYLGDEPTGADDEWRRWYRTILDFDPVPNLQQLSMPVLWLFGDPQHDRFGPVQASLDQVEYLKKLGKRYEIATFPGADHNLRFVEGGDVAPFETWLSHWLIELLRSDGLSSRTR